MIADNVEESEPSAGDIWIYYANTRLEKLPIDLSFLLPRPTYNTVKVWRIKTEVIFLIDPKATSQV